MQVDILPKQKEEEMVTEERADAQWVCQTCRKVGEFKLHGRGFIECSQCGSVFIVTNSGNLLLVRTKIEL